MNRLIYSRAKKVLGCSTWEVFLEEVDFELGFTGSMPFDLAKMGRSSNDILDRTNAHEKAQNQKMQNLKELPGVGNFPWKGVASPIEHFPFLPSQVTFQVQVQSLGQQAIRRHPAQRGQHLTECVPTLHVPFLL